MIEMDYKYVISLEIFIHSYIFYILRHSLLHTYAQFMTEKIPCRQFNQNLNIFIYIRNRTKMNLSVYSSRNAVEDSLCSMRKIHLTCKHR